MPPVENDSIITDESAQHDAADDSISPETESKGAEPVESEDDSSAQAPVDPRAARLASIANNVREDRQAERMQDEDSEHDLEEDDDPEDEPDPQPLAAQAPVYERDGKHFVKTKVNGVEREIPWEQALRTIQITESADQRMNAVAQREQELNDKEAQLNQRALAQQSSSQDSPSDQDVDIQAKQKELVSQYRQANWDGDDEKADQIMLEMIQLGRSPAIPTIDTDQITQQAAAMVLQQSEDAQREKEVKDAEAKFDESFPDIIKDPDLVALAKNHISQLWEKDPLLSPSEVTQQAGEQVMNWVKTMKGPSQKEERQQRKREAAAKTVSGNNRAAKAGREEAPPKTRSQVISDMRSRRPGATA